MTTLEPRDRADALLHRRDHDEELDHEGVSGLGRSVSGSTDAVIKGIDFPLHAPPDAYREAVTFLKSDPQSLGALVTTHKIDLFAPAATSSTSSIRMRC